MRISQEMEAYRRDLQVAKEREDAICRQLDEAHSREKALRRELECQRLRQEEHQAHLKRVLEGPFGARFRELMALERGRKRRRRLRAIACVVAGGGLLLGALSHHLVSSPNGSLPDPVEQVADGVVWPLTFQQAAYHGHAMEILRCHAPEKWREILSRELDKLDLATAPP